MFSKNIIEEIALRHLENTDLFLVEVKISTSNEIEILIDSEGSVSIDSCVELSKAIESELERDTEDFALTVASAGIGQPLKVFRQYKKLTGKAVEVILKSGTKITAILKEATPEEITLSYSQKVAIEGKKRKQDIEVLKTYRIEEIKSTVEHLDFK